MKKVISILIVAISLAACEQTLVYSERTGFKLGVGVNDDKSTPIEVTAGFKQTVVAFVPPKEGVQGEGKDKHAKGEAVSMFSGFRLENEDASITNLFNSTLRIRTQFASGNAAKKVASKPEVVRSIVDTASSSFLFDDASERLLKFWMPDGVNVYAANEAVLQNWMTDNGVPASIAYFINSEEYEALRKKAVADLNIP